MIVDARYDLYVKAVQESLLLKKEDLDFKSNVNYTYVLEHVNHNLGAAYLDLLKNEFNFVIII